MIVHDAPSAPPASATPSTRARSARGTPRRRGADGGPPLLAGRADDRHRGRRAGAAPPRHVLDPLFAFDEPRRSAGRARARSWAWTARRLSSAHGSTRRAPDDQGGRHRAHRPAHARRAGIAARRIRWGGWRRPRACCSGTSAIVSAPTAASHRRPRRPAGGASARRAARSISRAPIRWRSCSPCAASGASWAAARFEAVVFLPRRLHRAGRDAGGRGAARTLRGGGRGDGRVRYLSSQPWPFPASLMIGCIAEANERQARRRQQRAGGRALVLARRGPRHDRGRHPDGLVCPPPIAIANGIMRAWAWTVRSRRGL